MCKTSSSQLFDPTSVILGANYRDHWRSEDNSAVGDGNDVLTWTSVGIDGSVLTPVSSGARAQYVADYLGLGFPAVQTSGNACYFVSGSTSQYNYLHDGTGGTVIYVARHAGGTNAGVITSNSNGTSDGGHLTVFRDSGSNPDTVDTLVTRNIGGTFSARNRQQNVQNREEIYLLISTVVNDTPASERSKMWLNQNSVPYQNNVATDSFLSGTASNDFHVFCRPSGDLRWIGQIFEIIVADTDVTQQQVLDLQAWYNNKYGTFPIP